jgi:hypothetical protein
VGILISGVLAPDTTRRPWHRREAFWADLQFALDAYSKAAVVNPPQCGPHGSQQIGVEIRAAHRQIPFGRVLNFIHRVRAFLDCDAIPHSQYVNQFHLLLFKDLLKSTQISMF